MAKTKEPRLREVFLLRERARKELRILIAGISHWPGRDQFSHFYTGPDAKLKLFSDMDDKESERFQSTGEMPDGVINDLDDYLAAAAAADEDPRAVGALTGNIRGAERKFEEAQRRPTPHQTMQYLPALFRMLEKSLMRD